MDMPRVLETCAEIKQLCEEQDRLISEHSPANREKIRAVTDQIRKVAYQHIDAIRARPPAARRKGGSAKRRGGGGAATGPRRRGGRPHRQ